MTPQVICLILPLALGSVAGGYVQRCPDGRPVQECAETFGVSQDLYDKITDHAKHAKYLISKAFDVHFDDHDHSGAIPLMDDVIMTPELSDVYAHQALEMIKQQEKRQGTNHRTKRTAFIDLAQYRINRWPGSFPDDSITYDFVNISDHGRYMIKQAISEYHKKTCIRFKPSRFSRADIIFINLPSIRCASFLGRVKIKPQFIYVREPDCVISPGTVMHLLGHVLGAFHEHSRPDRQVRVDYHNTVKGSEGQFLTIPNIYIETFGQPYDFGSIMHYPGKTFSRNGRPTINAYDTHFQRSMGQRSQISFFDAKSINMNYCSPCGEHFRSEWICGTHGYRVKPNCNRCVCPDGLGGWECTRATGQSPGCSPLKKKLKARRDKIQCIRSPGYKHGGYTPGSRCTWKISAPNTGHNGTQCKIRVWFTGKFGIPVRRNVCHNWVELHHGISDYGYRFCGSTLPHGFRKKDMAFTPKPLMLVTFRSFENSDENILRNIRQPGFQLCFIADNCE